MAFRAATASPKTRVGPPSDKEPKRDVAQPGQGMEADTKQKAPQ